MKQIFCSLLIINCLIFSFLPTYSQSSGNNFYNQQKKYSRVRNSISEKEQLIKDLFDNQNINLQSAEIFIRVLKSEQLLELWAKNKTDGKYQLIKGYKICALSGKAGPKRQQGDLQIPEGFYHIDRFNPSSNFYLSLGINYPNKSDRILGVKGKLGGDIFIHGNCVTIGCVPITDDKIKELYLVAVIAKSNGQEKIPVHIFPAKLDGSDYEQLRIKNQNDLDLLSFWKNLETGYKYFETNRKLPIISINQTTGKYVLTGN